MRHFKCQKLWREVGPSDLFCPKGIETRHYTRMHVFADLRPYICTFPDCRDELAQFTTRAVWANHELTEHRYDQI